MREIARDDLSQGNRDQGFGRSRQFSDRPPVETIECFLLGGVGHEGLKPPVNVDDVILFALAKPFFTDNHFDHVSNVQVLKW